MKINLSRMELADASNGADDKANHETNEANIGAYVTLYESNYTHIM